MKGAIGNAFIMNLVITFIIIFFMLLIGSVAYSRAYKINKFLMDSLIDYVDDFNSVSNQKNICFSDNCVGDIKDWHERVNTFLARSGYILSNTANSCPSEHGFDSNGDPAFVYPNDKRYILKKDTTIGDYDYCIYQKRYYELDKLDDAMTKRRFSYLIISYMKFDFPVIGEFLKLPIVSESKVIINYH